MCALCGNLNYELTVDDTIYSWKPGSGNTFVTGEVFIAVPGEELIATIEDSGGVDTYDVSAYNTNLRISLDPTQSSLFSKSQLANSGTEYASTSNIFNRSPYASDARYLIENAIGGSGNDRIVGNIGNNELIGGAGDDRLFGMAGNDRLVGGKAADQLSGDDVLLGGTGRDQFHFAKGESGGADNIEDFISGEDNLLLSGYDRSELNGIVTSATQDGSAVVLHLDDFTTVTLVDVELHELSKSAFMLG